MQYSAAERNREPIREVLAKYLTHVSGSKTILEVSSGDGTHVSHFAKAFPSSIEWHPTEYDEQVLVNLQVRRYVDCIKVMKEKLRKTKENSATFGTIHYFPLSADLYL